MQDLRFDIRLVAFSGDITDPTERLQAAFKLTEAQSARLIERLPAVIKRNVSAAEAVRYLHKLTRLGGEALAVNTATGEVVRQPQDLLVPATPEESAPTVSHDQNVARGSDHSIGLPAASTEREATGASADWLVASRNRPSTQSASVRKSAAGAMGALEAAISAELDAHREEITAPVFDEDTVGQVGGDANGAMPAFLQAIPAFEGNDWTPLNAPPEGEEVPRGRFRVQPRRAPSRELQRTGVGFWVAVALLVGVIGVMAIAAFTGGASGEEMERFDANVNHFLPTMEIMETATGSLASGGTNTLELDLRVGRCYGWLAVTTDSDLTCDLDIILMGPEGPYMADGADDNFPIVFHCPESDKAVTLMVSNAGSASCSYALASLERMGNAAYPIAPYLELYRDYLVGLGAMRPIEPMSEPMSGTLYRDETASFPVNIPAGECRTYVGVSRQIMDLDATLQGPRYTADSNRRGDNFPYVSHCADDRPFEGMLEFSMLRGGGPFVWQEFRGGNRN